MATGYPYSPLDSSQKEIRILWVEVQSLFDPSPLKCNLLHASFKRGDFPRYEAISYTWGDASHRKAMYINNVLVSVPESADSAVRHLYCIRTWKTRMKIWYSRQLGADLWIPIWIDSICVDQMNLEERSRQVNLMGEVYSRAGLVAIWLGKDETGTAARAEKALKRLCSPFVTKNKLDIKNPLAPRARRPAMSHRDWEAIELIYSSTWFTRTWIVQEALLNSEIRCYKGDQAFHMNWVLCCPFSSQLENSYPHEVYEFSAKGRLGWENAHKMMIISQSAPDQGESVPLSKILKLTVHFEATHLHDKIYGFLGLVDGRIREAINVDYECAITDLYTQVSRLTIEREQSLTILLDTYTRAASVPDLVEANLPSWAVPCHWKPVTVPRAIAGSPGLLEGLSDYFGFQEVGDDHVIKVRGLVLGALAADPITIMDESLQWRWRDLVSNFLESFGAIWDVAKEMHEEKDQDQLAYELAAILLNENSTTLDRRESPLVRLADSFAAFGSLPGRGEKSFNVDDMIALQERLRPAIDIMQTKSCGRGFFSTTNGRLGTAWPKARKGDQVCILFGCPVPLVLRPEGDRCTLVGDALMHGAMAGEDIIRLRDEGRLEDEMRWFEIQ